MTNLSVTDWDLFHLRGGTTVAAFGSQVTLGLGYTFGEIMEDQPAEADDPVLGDLARVYFSNLKYTYSSFKWILGFSF
jgi:hypothetical protein